VPCGTDYYPNLPGIVVKAQRRTAPNGLEVLHARSKPRRRMFSLRPGIPLERPLYWGCAGSDKDIAEEAQKFASNHVVFKDSTWARFLKDWDQCLDKKYEPLEWDIVIEQLLQLKTGVGQPWKQVYPNKQAMLDDFTQAGLIEYLETLEREVLDGRIFPEFTWDVFSKLDKYKKSKLDNNRLRTIQGGDVILLMLMLRWFYPAVKDLYHRHSRYYVVADNHTFVERVTMAFAESHTCGMDATGFDRGVPANVIERVMTVLLDRSGCPDALQALMVDAVAYGQLQLPWGELLAKVGGNPSGVFLTTIINCAFNDLMHIEVYQGLYGLDFDSCCHWIVTGDDSVDGFRKGASLPTPDELISEFSNFGLEYKIDLLDGEFYPPELGCHAPYLSKVSVVRDGVVVPVPSEPRRNLGWYYTIPETPLSTQLASIIGIRESLMPFMVVQALDPSYPVPTVVEEFFSETADLIGQMAVMGIGQATDVYSSDIAALHNASVPDFDL